MTQDTETMICRVTVITVITIMIGMLIYKWNANDQSLTTTNELVIAHEANLFTNHIAAYSFRNDHNLIACYLTNIVKQLPAGALNEEASAATGLAVRWTLPTLQTNTYIVAVFENDTNVYFLNAQRQSAP